MTPELFRLIQQAVENGITAASWIVFLIAVVGAALGAVFGSYIKRKSENYGTKEDFAELLRQRKVRHQSVVIPSFVPAHHLAPLWRRV